VTPYGIKDKHGSEVGGIRNRTRRTWKSSESSSQVTQWEPPGTRGPLTSR
jgi:hypothetical protein